MPPRRMNPAGAESSAAAMGADIDEGTACLLSYMPLIFRTFPSSLVMYAGPAV